MFQRLAYDDWNQGASTTWANAYSEAVDMVRELPSAQQQCKTGKWEVFCPNLKYKYHCSECGAYHSAMYDFCPTCGADMRGKQDEVD